MRINLNCIPLLYLFPFFVHINAKKMSAQDSYDQYADQLLNSVFQSAKHTDNASNNLLLNSINPNHEHLRLNQFLQHQSRISPSLPITPLPSPFPVGNHGGEWLLLQQLQQQKDLLEKQQQQILSSSFIGAHQSPSAPTLLTSAYQSPRKQPEEPKNLNEKLKDNNSKILSPLDEKRKIPRVPVQKEKLSPNQQQEIILDDSNSSPGNVIETHAFQNASNSEHIANVQTVNKINDKQQQQPKRDFLYRTWSRRNFKNREATQNKPISVSYSHEVITQKSDNSKRKKQMEQTRPVVERKPSFWKPREERPKGWWKGNTNKQHYVQVEANNELATEDEFEQEEVILKNDSGKAPIATVMSAVSVDQKKTVTPTKNVVVKQRDAVVATKKGASTKKGGTFKANSRRPMAFKTPTVRKKSDKVKSKKSANKQNSVTPNKSVMYVIPQQSPLFYHPQQQSATSNIFMPTQPFSFMSASDYGYNNPSREERNTTPKRKTTILNPRESSNDKCFIM
ncbi:MAG: hypothetical protein EXX96DRAFT_312468 [Benjaminiella poitrasii]|nr:MAG: hypothetical protein EXX96DRAFT_312468 [Benjaminiella poitrasii]